MKVAFFSSTGRIAGGAAICLREILNHFLEREIELFVILSAHGDFEEFLISKGIRYTIIQYHDWLRPQKDHKGFYNSLKWKIKEIQNAFQEKKAYRILKQEKPDIYHINVLYNSCGAKSAHKLHIPVIWHLREFSEIDENTPFFHNKQKAIDLINKSERIICVSKSIKEYYSKYLAVEKMIIIYDGIIIPSNVTKTHLLHNPISITLSGGAKVKGHTDIINAARLLIDRGYNNIHISIVGRFSDHCYYLSLKETVNKYQLVDYIEFTGYQRDMNNVWNQTDIAVICSRYESFGLSICEAMLRGIPVVCAKTTGTWEICQKVDYSRVYEIGNFEQLANFIENIILKYNDVTKEMRNTATKIQKYYDIKLSIEQFEGILTELYNRQD